MTDNNLQINRNSIIKMTLTDQTTKNVIDFLEQ